MNLGEAVQRINQGIGFRPAGNNLEQPIINAIQEAQRDLESGKTLPRFLLIEDFPLTLAAGESTVALPPGFIRESDDTRIRIGIQMEITKPVFLSRRYFIDAFQAFREANVTRVPAVYVIRNTVINFVNPSDRTYLMALDYYKTDDVLAASTQTNKWLTKAPEWLWGEAGWRLAMDLERPNAVQKFDSIRKAGRAACLAEDIAAELASGPLEMGANL